MSNSNPVTQQPSNPATRVSVVGLGREGLAVTRVLARAGAQVTVGDNRDAAALAAPLAALGELGDLDVRLALGGNRPEEFLDCDLLVLSPGVDKRTPLVQEALRRGIRISSETELFFERCPAHIIGITGSAGKTTTTTLVGEMLRRGTRGQGPGGGEQEPGSIPATQEPVYPATQQPSNPATQVFVGGNIGRPLLELLPQITPQAWVVLELSSFQLEWLRVSPHIAAVTNITPNHLDRHETMAAYIAAKSNIVAHQSEGDVAVLNHDEPNAAALAALTPARVQYFGLARPTGSDLADGAYMDGDRLVLVQDGCAATLCRAGDLRVPGRHNIANALAAAAVAGARGVDPADIGAVIRGFGGVLHRLQPVATIDDVTYYDDSIATAPERTLAALDALTRPVVLILGGRDKHLPWDQLAAAAVARCRGAVLIGEAAPLIRRHLEAALAAVRGGAGHTLPRDGIVEAASMAEAVARAADLARPGDAVVLAPGGTSFDMYRDFEERGDDFAREVRRLEDHV